MHRALLQMLFLLYIPLIRAPSPPANEGKIKKCYFYLYNLELFLQVLF